MSYWVASDKVPIKQKSVRIPAENGTNYIANQEIRIRIDPSCKFFNPSATYLEASVKITPPTYDATPSGSSTGPSPTRLQLDGETGFQSLIRDIRVHDSNGVLLEEIQNYNTMVAMKYDYQTNDSLKNKRALTEGATKHDPRAQSWYGGIKSDCNNVINNPYVGTNFDATLNASFKADDFIDCKVCIPLHTGILSSEKIFPNMLMGGITITMLLEDNARSFRQLDTAMEFRNLTSNPVVELFNASDGLVNNGSFLTTTLAEKNGQFLNVQQCPFVVGEVLRLVEVDYTAETVTNIPFANASGNPEIVEIAMDGDKIKLTLNASVQLNHTGAVKSSTANNDLYWVSNSVGKATSYGATYTVSDVNLIVQEVDAGAGFEQSMMKKMKEGGKIMYDFPSVTTYKYSQLSSDRVANIRLPINNERCKSIICVPTDATVYTEKEVLNASTTYKIMPEALEKPNAVNIINNADVFLRSNRPNLEGISDSVSDYQFLYDGKLQPSRRIPLSKTSTGKSIDAQHLIELDKALSQAGITGHSMAKFNRNFLIGRALALGDGVYDARNKDFSIQVNYNESTAPSKNKLWLSYVFHLRRIEVSGDSIQVIV